LTITNKLSN